MRLISRNDASLVVGLVAGTVVIFQQPLRFVWETALDVQQRYHVDLLPALTIFLGVFIFHEARKRQEVKAGAMAAAAEAAQARVRSAELERLVTFGQALANAQLADGAQGEGRIPLVVVGTTRTRNASRL